MHVFSLVSWLHNFIGRLAVSLGLLTFAVVPASAFTMTFDELGNCSSTVGTCSSVLAPDPTGTVTGNVLIFTLPEPTFTGNVNILDPGGALSDHLRWIFTDPLTGSVSDTACDSGATPCAQRMIFYSLDDLGGQTPTFMTMLSTTEDANGRFEWVVPPPGVNIYIGFSNVPLPAALPLFATGLGALGLLGWRRKRKAAALAA
jgi:hypothetical protein